MNTASNNPATINVLFLAAEADPLVKVGGLGDVAGSLPRSLRALNQPMRASIFVDARLVIPFHPSINRDQYSLHFVTEYNVRSIHGDIPVKAYSMEVNGLPVYLIDGAPIAQETAIYSSDLEADGYKYVFFSLAALELPKRLGWRLDILHANDWHTAAAAYSLSLNRPIEPLFQPVASLLTVHNLPYLGAMTSSALAAFDLPPAEHTSLPAWASHMALPLGLLATDRIVAVSPGYAKEIMTEGFGSGLHVFLRAHANKVTGILNGLDTQKWDPSTDAELALNYSAATLEARLANKTLLQEELGLDKAVDVPLLAMVTRMDPQKGVDLAVEALRILYQASGLSIPKFQAVFLGTGSPVLEQAVNHLEREYPDQVRARIAYDEKLSRHIYAGADILLMPSRYEPCGLSQMIAMRYGCIPVARATGGLSDTIHDSADTGQSTGFLFKPAKPEALADAIRRALTVYTQSPKVWQEMQLRGMQADFSWLRSAREYLKQYKKLLESRTGVGKYV